MQHLTEQDRQNVIEAAERCERFMRYEASDVARGDYEGAANAAQGAEVASFLAFITVNPASGWFVGEGS